jgi:hypothetical protein
LEKYLRETLDEEGYQEISTPIMVKKDVFDGLACMAPEGKIRCAGPIPPVTRVTSVQDAPRFRDGCWATSSTTGTGAG